MDYPKAYDAPEFSPPAGWDCHSAIKIDDVTYHIVVPSEDEYQSYLPRKNPVARAYRPYYGTWDTDGLKFKNVYHAVLYIYWLHEAAEERERGDFSSVVERL